MRATYKTALVGLCAFLLSSLGLVFDYEYQKQNGWMMTNSEWTNLMIMLMETTGLIAILFACIGKATSAMEEINQDPPSEWEVWRWQSKLCCYICIPVSSATLCVSWFFVPGFFAWLALIVHIVAVMFGFVWWCAWRKQRKLPAQVPETQGYTC